MILHPPLKPVLIKTQECKHKWEYRSEGNPGVRVFRCPICKIYQVCHKNGKELSTDMDIQRAIGKATRHYYEIEGQLNPIKEERK